jgi:FAD/FMN-containing dehydrogenase
MSLPGAFVETISSITGPAGIVGPDEDVDAYVTEWRSRFVGNAALIILPGSTDEAAQVVAACNAHGVAMVPQGGNTGLCGGAIPFSSAECPQVLLSTRRLRSVRSIDAAGFTITAEAGTTVHQLKTAAAEHERLFALSLASEGSATLGGVVSTNAGGVNVLRYGTMRDQVLGLEAVLPDGQVLSQLQGLRKDNTGYRLGDLLVGAEGTLAFVTAAVCRLFALPKSTSTALLALESIDDCMSIAGQIQSDATDDVTALELISDAGMALVERYIADTQSPFARRSPWYLLVEFSGPDDWASLETRMASVFEELAGDPRITDACLAGSIAQRDELWKLRHSLSEAQKLAGSSFKHDVSIPPNRMAEFVAQCTRRVLECVSS